MNCLFLLLLLSCWSNGSGNCGRSNDCDDDCGNARDNGCNNARGDGRRNNGEREGSRENCDNNRGNNRGNDCDFSVNTPPRRPRTENMQRGRDDDFDCGCDDNRREPRVFPPYPGENCGCED